MSHAAWVKATRNLPTKSAKIRALDALGVSRADIARFLDIRYQHVRNVLTAERPTTSPRHVAEASEPYEDRTELRVMPDGGVRIPPTLAARLGVKPGERLLAFEQDGGLWVATPRASREYAKALARKMAPSDVSLVDELIEWRRREAAAFDREGAGADKA